MRLEGGGPSTGAERVPRLAPGCDPARLSLTPAEGYLLSRIDGATPLSLLRQIGGAAARGGRPLPRALGEGGRASSGPAPAPGRRGAAGAGAGPGRDRAASCGRRRRASTRASTCRSRCRSGCSSSRALLDRPYHEILGVAARRRRARRSSRPTSGSRSSSTPTATSAATSAPTRRASRRIFKKVLEAYELLSDPTTRAEVQRSRCRGRRRPSRPPPRAPRRRGAGPPPPRAGCAPRAERPRAASPRASRTRKRKAKSFFESGMAAFKKERWLEAAGSVRLAIAFDPGERRLQERLRRRAAQGPRGARARAAQGGRRRLPAATTTATRFRLYEEALHYRPFDAELSHKTAAPRVEAAAATCARRRSTRWRRASWRRTTRAYRRTLGQVYKAAGLIANAKRELQNALAAGSQRRGIAGRN